MSFVAASPDGEQNFVALLTDRLETGAMDTFGTMGLEPEYRRLKAAWDSGRRDREDALHLLYLSWMHWADPPFVTGMDDDPEAGALWRTIAEHFGGEASTDAEFLHVAGLMAGLFPWGLGDEAEWEARGKRMQRRSLSLRSEGFTPEFFEGRGEYGDYFAHHARLRLASCTGGRLSPVG